MGQNAFIPHGHVPTGSQRTWISEELRMQYSRGNTCIMLSWMPLWASRMGVATEHLVEMMEYLVETGAPEIRSFSLDMHLIDAVIQCRLRREGMYSREEWIK